MTFSALGDKKMPFFPGGFTVLMSVYQGDNLSLFRRAIQSVYANTLLPDAFVLVVDGPVPEILLHAILHQQVMYGFDVLHLPVNVGLARALNAGLMQVKTEWVVRADADDYNFPDRFAILAAALIQSKNSLDLIGGAIREVGSDGREIAVRRTVEEHAEIVRYAIYRNPFNHMTVAYRTQVAIRCGCYPNIYLREDYALWAQMIASGARVLNLPNILVEASAGKDLYKRRGGLRYAFGEISLQHHLVNAGLKKPSMALLHGIGRAIIFILPSAIRGWIYENLLRHVR